MYSASHNLEVSKQLLVIKNILIKDGKRKWNSIMEVLEQQTKDFALNPVGGDNMGGKFGVGE